MTIRSCRGFVVIALAGALGACELPGAPGPVVKPLPGGAPSVATSAAPAAAPPVSGAPAAYRSTAPPREEVPPAVRALLHARMGRHAEVLRRLVEASLRLDHRAIGAAVDALLGEGALARADPTHPDLLNATVPLRFFELQDEMREGARALAAASAVGNDAAVATSFALITSSCIRCHAAFLAPAAGGGTP